MRADRRARAGLAPSNTVLLPGEHGGLPLQVYDTRADVYSWGVLLAELVAQKPPYDGMYLTPTQVWARRCTQHLTAPMRAAFVKNTEY